MIPRPPPGPPYQEPLRDHIDSVSDLINRGLVVDSPDVIARRQPDGRILLKLHPALKPKTSAAPAATPPPQPPGDCPCPDGLAEIYCVSGSPIDGTYSIGKIGDCVWCGRSNTIFDLAQFAELSIFPDIDGNGTCGWALSIDNASSLLFKAWENGNPLGTYTDPGSGETAVVSACSTTVLPCDQEPSACCLPNGTCDNMTPSDCIAAGGTPFDGSCDDDPPPPCRCPCYDDLPSTVVGTYGSITMTLEKQSLSESGGDCGYRGYDEMGNSIAIGSNPAGGGLRWSGSFNASGVGIIWDGDGPEGCENPQGSYGDGSLVIS